MLVFYLLADCMELIACVLTHVTLPLSMSITISVQ